MDISLQKNKFCECEVSKHRRPKNMLQTLQSWELQQPTGCDYKLFEVSYVG